MTNDDKMDDKWMTNDDNYQSKKNGNCEKDDDHYVF